MSGRRGRPDWVAVHRVSMWVVPDEDDRSVCTRAEHQRGHDAVHPGHLAHWVYMGVLLLITLENHVPFSKVKRHEKVYA